MAQSSSVFITAADARQNPIREYVVHEEARLIENAILDAVKFGLFETTVSDGTPMTNSSTQITDVWTVDPSTDQLYVPNHGFSNGQAVTVSSTIALPAPLQSTAYYYVIYVDPDHIKLAGSYAHAMSGTPLGIDITAGVTMVSLDASGTGYIQPPVVSFSGGTPTTSATAKAYLASWGSLVGVAMITNGAGYGDVPSVQIVSQGDGATAGTVSYKAVGISISSGGSSYRVGDLLSVAGGTGTPATASVKQVDTNGSILSIQLMNPGSYTVLPVLAGAATNVMPSGGSDATVNLTMGIGSISVSSSGTGYTNQPRVIISDATGVGAAASALLSGGSVSSILIADPGHGYTGPTTVEIASGGGASAIVSMQTTSVASVQITDDGGYTYVDAPAVQIDPVGSGASAGTVTLKVVSCQLTSPGTGYKANDNLVISGGTSTDDAYIRVLSVNATGAIQSFTLESGGSYTALPGLTYNPVNGGSGQLASFNLSMGVGSIDIDASGSGYMVPPTLLIDAPVGGGVQARAVANITSGSVTTFGITVSGSGYTSIPAVLVQNGSGATAESTLVPTSVAILPVDQHGSGYSYATVTISGGGATRNATASAVIVGDQVSSIDLIDPGEGYTSPPTVEITGDGIDAHASAVLVATPIDRISVIAGGSGYNYPPTVSIGGDAAAVSILSSTGIDRIIITDQGTSYTSSPTIYLIPGQYQTTAPIPPTMVAQIGFSIDTIAVTGTGAGYQSAPSVTIAPPQITGGIDATAIAYIGAGSGTFGIIPYPESKDYFRAWKGQPMSNQVLSRPYTERMDTVIAYFTNLGYTINRLTNPNTNTNLMWSIRW